MYFVYILRSKKDKGFYIGFTNNIHRRLGQHNRGLTTSTRKRRPLEMIYYEAFIDKKDAMNRERYLKGGYGRRSINTMLKNTLDPSI